MSNDSIIKLVIENDYFALVKIFANKKPQLNYEIECNKSSNMPDEKTDNFKNDKISLLHAAAFYNSLESFCFLETKYQTERTENVLRKLSTKSYFPLHYACFSGAREIVAYILDKDPEQASLIPSNIDHHFLFYAVYGGDPVIMNELCSKGADPDEIHNKKDDPIGKAISLCQIECLKVLLKYEKKSTNSGFETPAMLAAKNCHPDALKLLITCEDDITYFSPSNQSVISSMFFYASGNIYKTVLINILRKYPGVRIEPPDGINTLCVCHWICKIADKEVALLMIETKDVDLNRGDDLLYTGPYHLSTQKNLKETVIIEILEILISHGFKLNHKCTEDARTQYPIEYFLNAMVRREKVIRFLLESGAKLNLPSSKSKNKTIYQFIKESPNSSLIELVEKYKDN